MPHEKPLKSKDLPQLSPHPAFDAIRAVIDWERAKQQSGPQEPAHWESLEALSRLISTLPKTMLPRVLAMKAAQDRYAAVRTHESEQGSNALKTLGELQIAHRTELMLQSLSAIVSTDGDLKQKALTDIALIKQNIVQGGGLQNFAEQDYAALLALDPKFWKRETTREIETPHLYTAEIAQIVHTLAGYLGSQPHIENARLCAATIDNLQRTCDSMATSMGLGLNDFYYLSKSRAHQKRHSASESLQELKGKFWKQHGVPLLRKESNILDGSMEMALDFANQIRIQKEADGFEWLVRRQELQREQRQALDRGSR